MLKESRLHLDLKAGPKASLTKESALVAARDKTETILDTLSTGALARSSWYKPGWLEQVLNQTIQNFESFLRDMAKPFPSGQGPVELSEPGHRRRRSSAPVGGSQAAEASRPRPRLPC